MEDPSIKKVLIGRYLMSFPSLIQKANQSQLNSTIEIWERFFERNSASDAEIGDVLIIAMDSYQEPASLSCLSALLSAIRAGSKHKPTQQSTGENTK